MSVAQDPKNLVRDYEREPVPEERRKGALSIAVVWLGVGMTIAAFLLGGTVGAGLTLSQSLVAILAGSLLITIVAAFCGVIGARTGLSTAMVSRFAFGSRGSYVVAMILALGSYGWFGVQTGLFGDTALEVLRPLGAGEVPPGLLIFIGGLLMTTTAIFGYKAIEKLSILVVPTLAILMFVSLGLVLRDESWSALVASPPPGEPLSLGVAISLVAGSFMVGAVVAPDVSRYARQPTHAILAAVLGFQIGYSVIVFVGSILAQATGEENIVQIMLALGWGVLAFLVLIAAQWTTNDNNLYSAALAFSVVFRRLPKWQLTAAAGVLGTLLAMVGIYGQFVPWLLVLSALVPPIGGVLTADYFLVDRSLYRFENLDRVANIRYVSWVSLLAGALAAFMTTPDFPGWGLFTLTTVPAIDSFLVALLTQTVLGRLVGGASKAPENSE
jgi:cytosine permease